ISLLKHEEELNVKPTLEYPLSVKTIFSEENQLFIGFSDMYSGSLKYDRETYSETNYEDEITISPNPTNGFVNINLNCNQPIINFQINDTNGLLLFQGFAPYQVG